MSRRAGYYYRYRPRTSVNQALNTITRRAKTAEKQNHKRGIYRDEFSQYMHENVVITTFNNCLVCMRFANKSYIGRAACNMLEAQLQYRILILQKYCHDPLLLNLSSYRPNEIHNFSHQLLMSLPGQWNN